MIICNEWQRCYKVITCKFLDSPGRDWCLELISVYNYAYNNSDNTYGSWSTKQGEKPSHTNQFYFLVKCSTRNKKYPEEQKH